MNGRRKRGSLLPALLILAALCGACREKPPEKKAEETARSMETVQSTGAAQSMETVQSVEAAKSADGREEENGDDAAKDAAEGSAETEKTASSPAAQAFAAVLRNEKAFFCTYNIPYANRDIIQEYRECLKDIRFGDRPLNIRRFAVVDLDHDGAPEVVLEMDEYAGSVILRYEQGEVRGNIVGYRSLFCLKENGLFLSASASDEDAWSRLFFTGDTFFSVPLLSRTGSVCYAGEEEIDGQRWQELYRAADGMKDAEWQDFSEASIGKWIEENHAFDSAPPEEEETGSGRQDYLNSLSRLIGLTYDYAKKSPQERSASAAEYYAGCEEELERMYRTCLDVLPDEEAEKLAADQQRWQDAFSRRQEADLERLRPGEEGGAADESLYFTFGDRILGRTMYLADLYYGRKAQELPEGGRRR